MSAAMMMMCWSNKWIIEQRSIHNDGGNTAAAAADKLLQQSSLSTPSLLSNLLSTPLNFAPGSSLPPSHNLSTLQHLSRQSNEYTAIISGGWSWPIYPTQKSTIYPTFSLPKSGSSTRGGYMMKTEFDAVGTTWEQTRRGSRRQNDGRRTVLHLYESQLSRLLFYSQYDEAYVRTVPVA